jgi:hypothetical protein
MKASAYFYGIGYLIDSEEQGKRKILQWNGSDLFVLDGKVW